MQINIYSAEKDSLVKIITVIILTINTNSGQTDTKREFNTYSLRRHQFALTPYYDGNTYNPPITCLVG